MEHLKFSKEDSDTETVGVVAKIAKENEPLLLILDRGQILKILEGKIKAEPLIGRQTKRRYSQSRK